MDLISRQAAIATAISGRVRTLPTTEDGENWIRVNEVRDSLLSLPSAERHGRWIIYTVSPWDGEDVKCSVCGEKGCAPYWDYCPHCGSQMVDVVSENELV